MEDLYKDILKKAVKYHQVKFVAQDAFQIFPHPRTCPKWTNRLIWCYKVDVIKSGRHFYSKDRPLSSLAVHFDAKERSIWLKSVQFRSTSHFEDRPLPSILTVPFISRAGAIINLKTRLSHTVNNYWIVYGMASLLISDVFLEFWNFHWPSFWDLCGLYGVYHTFFYLEQILGELSTHQYFNMSVPLLHMSLFW